MSYGCADYREEMTLVSLKNRLKENNLSDEEKSKIEKEIKKLEKKMGL
ncbi:hypothetical protein ACFL20_05055 [Spirochaetota bacterium]